MSRVLVIGCGGVASVAIHKICQVSEVFSDLCIASRTVSKCDKLADELKGKTSTNITTAKVDADNTDEVIALINEFKPDVVLNVALPYQDLTIMDACLACKVPYVDTANYECEDTDNPEWRKVYEERCKRLGFTAYFDYSWQWAYREKYKEAVQEIIKWIISGCDLHADNLSENAKKLLRRHVDKKNFLAKSKTFYPFF